MGTDQRFNGAPLGSYEVAVSTDLVRCIYMFGRRDRPPIMLITHGWGLDCSTVAGLADSLRDCGAVCFDAPHHGSHNGNDSTLTEYSRAVEAVLSEFPSIHTVVAHSLSGVAVLAALQRRATNVSDVVLVAPPLSLEKVLERWAAENGIGGRRVTGIRDELHRRNEVPITYWNVVERSQGLDARIRMVFDSSDQVIPESDITTILAAEVVLEAHEVNGSGHIGIVGHRATVEFVRPGSTIAIDHSRPEQENGHVR